MNWLSSGQRSRLETVLGIFLRTPGLFIIDYCWHLEKSRFLFVSWQRTNYLTSFITNLVLLNGFLLLLLPIKIVRSLYSHFICGSLLLIAHFLSHYYVHLDDPPQHLIDLFDPNHSLRSAINFRQEFAFFRTGYEKVANRVNELLIAKQLSFLAINVFIGIVITFLLKGPQKPLIPVVAWYLLPVVARFFHLSTQYLELIHNTCSLLVFLSLLQYFYRRIPFLISRLKFYYNQLISHAELNGFTDFMISTFSKIFVPTHFLLFWTIAFVAKLYQHITLSTTNNVAWPFRLLIVLSNMCTSPVSLIATAIVITYVSYAILFIVKLYLWGSAKAHLQTLNQPTIVDNIDNQNRPENLVNTAQPATENEANDAQLPARNNVPLNAQHTGWEEGLTTILLSVLTGITELKQSARVAVFTIILFVVFSSLFQSMLNIAEPIILSLSTHHGKSALHHIKVFTFCAFLFVFPLYTTWMLAQIFPVDFWMAVVLSTSVLTSAQVLDLLIIHCLLWYDATRNEPWAPLDELVYCVRGIAKLIEIAIAALVVIAGLHEAFFHQFNWTNILILLAHCYFNVLLRFQTGYANFIKRRNAVRKSNLLQNASKEQLERLNDVCTICFMDLANANTSVHTQCKHFFHRICLRRWLCFQDRCPICSRSVYNEPEQSEQLQQQSANVEQPAN